MAPLGTDIRTQTNKGAYIKPSIQLKNGGKCRGNIQIYVVVSLQMNMQRYDYVGSDFKIIKEGSH